MRRGLEGFREDADLWRTGIGARVPVYRALMGAAADLFAAPAGTVEEAARGRVEAAWRERRWNVGFDRPLLLMAALRAEARRAGPRHPLYAAIGAPAVELAAATRAALAAALADAPPRLFVDLATRRLQTNETSRAVTWLWPAALAGAGDGRRPLVLCDIGCSAGLNLTANLLPAPWTDGGGAPIPVIGADARVVARHGFDAAPVDVEQPEDLRWLQACIWPGENARLERLARAVEAFRALARDPAPPRLEICDLGDVPARLGRIADAAPPEAMVLAFQTVVRGFLSAAASAGYGEAMIRWVAAETRPGPRRLWLELEGAPEATPNDAAPMALDATFTTGDGVAQRRTLARCSYHPSTLNVDTAAIAAFTRSGDVGR